MRVSRNVEEVTLATVVGLFLRLSVLLAQTLLGNQLRAMKSQGLFTQHAGTLLQ